MSQRCRAVLAIIVMLPLAGWVAARADEVPTFVGAQACANCHAAEFDAWKGSHHALAMQKATEAIVLGDFRGAQLDHFSVTTTFFRDGDKFMARTDGPDGALHDYPIAYAFGVYPLQQYLIAFPGQRYQALGIAWDSRPKDQGGQRWFHLYPAQNLKPGDPLHWTGRDQTWNYQCAFCHSTNLKKNYDLAANTYATSWTDLDVSCEACHGPGSRHITWAKPLAEGSSYPSGTDDTRKGLTNSLKPTDGGHWEMNPESGIARRTEELVSTELETCAACHSRRKLIAANPVPGQPYLDGFQPALLEPGLYHADGQIDGEVYEYGSFLQSRMHAAGVTCSNCHDPHTAKLRAEGNALCAQCHMPEKFDVAQQHHHHQPGSAGAECVNCHMPAKNFMVIDARRDHSIRVPRADLSTELGTPNACSQCHAWSSAEWAAETVARWFPDGRQNTPHFGTALHAGRVGAADAEQQLDRLILDKSQPAITRASALPLLAPYASPASEPAIKVSIADPDPLVRMAAPRALSGAPPPAFVNAITPLLSDPVRAVRIEAARALAGTDLLTLTPQHQSAFVKASAELVAAEKVDAERPESHLNLGLLDLRRRELPEAESEYRTALRLDPKFVPALVNLADLDRAQNRDDEGAELLRQAMAVEPDNADARYAFGLYLVRKRDYAGALDLLRRAHELTPDNARYAYVYAVALNSSGARGDALALLEQTHRQHPADRNVLMALVSVARDNGDVATALGHARELLILDPSDAQLRSLVSELQKGQ